MLVQDVLYFAPRISFSELNLDDDGIGEKWRDRIVGFYLEPAKLLANSGHAFACGILVLCAIDAISVYEYQTRQSNDKLAVISYLSRKLLCFRDRTQIRAGKRFISFVSLNIISFNKKSNARKLWRLFRCKLIHEARIGQGGEFSLSQSEIIKQHAKTNIITINPQKLIDETQSALLKFTEKISTDRNCRSEFVKILRENFYEELHLTRS